MARAIADHGKSILGGLDDGEAAPGVVALGVRVAAGAASLAFGRTAGGRLSRSGDREFVGAGALEGATDCRLDWACACPPKVMQQEAIASAPAMTGLFLPPILRLPLGGV